MSRSWWHNRSGKSRIGCLLQIALVIGVAYYGFDWGKTYFKFWSIREEMRSQAVLASGVDDPTIQRRLLAKMNALELPSEAQQNLSIRRRLRPREITISTSYVVYLLVPFLAPIERTVNPEVRQRL